MFMKILVAGWFSFEKCNATAGDLMARDLVCEWIENAGHAYDIALAPPFVGGVDGVQSNLRLIHTLCLYVDLFLTSTHILHQENLMLFWHTVLTLKPLFYR
jgi:hypothetical protein